jgi:Na+-transporting NADH:ubiquinone oxidoreductase subunit C
MKNKPYFAVIYMFVVTAFFSSVLIGFARLTRDKVQANQQIAFEKAILQVFPEITAETNTQIHRVFTERFKLSGGAYVYRKDGQIAGYAVPVEGQGFWAPIKGIIGLAANKQTVTGVAFYEQSETPGLGARITEPDFRNSFKGLKLNEREMPIDFRPAGTELKGNEVHAITGATQTCIRLEKLINDSLIEWRQQLKQEDTQ